jgi:hypothetical protein
MCWIVADPIAREKEEPIAIDAAQSLDMARPLAYNGR